MKARGLVTGAALCFALFAVAPAGAHAKMTKLTLRTAAGVLAPGAELEAEAGGGIHEGLSLVTASGTTACAADLLALSLAGNEAANDPATVTSGSFEGCKSSNFGPVALATAHHPWPMTFSKKGVAEIKKGSAGKLTIVETIPFFNPSKCVYESGKLVAGFEPGPAGEPGPLTLTFTGAANVLKTNKPESNAACAREAHLEGALRLVSGGEEVLAET